MGYKRAEKIKIVALSLLIVVFSLMLLMIGGTAIVVVGIYYLICHSDIFKIDKQNEVISKLSYNEYTPISIAKNIQEDSVRNILLCIMKNEQCEFFAKATDQDKVSIIAKDKHGDIVYECETLDNNFLKNTFDI